MMFIVKPLSLFIKDYKNHVFYPILRNNGKYFNEFIYKSKIHIRYVMVVNKMIDNGTRLKSL